MDPGTLRSVELAEVVEVGRGIDLSACRYRSNHDAPTPPYYHLLAGLVRVTGATRILEIGTFHGGATMSMALGVDPAADRHDVQIATVDVVRRNDPGFADFPHVHRVISDSLARSTGDGVVDHFDQHIDLLFVDSGHDYRQAFENVAVYGNRLKPTYVVLDDIRLTRSMAKMWADLPALVPGDAHDVSAEAGREKAGFGLVEVDYPHVWPEMGSVRHAAWSAYWWLGRTAMPRVPAGARNRVRRIVRGQTARTTNEYA